MNRQYLLEKWIVVIGLWMLPVTGFALPVNITQDLPQLTVRHGNQTVTIQRDQNTHAVIEADFAKTSRNCPPFCIQPMEAAPGVKTIGELELIHFMMNEVNQQTGLLVDARTPDWHAQGVIPGSINIPYTDISPSLGANSMEVEQILKKVGATKNNDEWEFSKAKTLALWCNGPWCAQSQTAIHGLLELKYPPEKLLYYRGGMQMWKLFGLTVVPPMANK